MTTSRSSIAIILSLATGLLFACGENEPPKIRNVQITQCPGTDFEAVVADGDEVTCSPIEVTGRISDNVAVVGPIITLEASRYGVLNPMQTIGSGEIGRAGEFSFDPIEDLVLLPGNHIDLEAIDVEGKSTEISIRFDWIGYDDVLGQDWLLMTPSNVDNSGPEIEWLDIELDPVEEGLYVRAGEPLSVLVAGAFADDGIEIDSMTLEACIAEIPGRNIEINIEREGEDGSFTDTITLLDPRAVGKAAAKEDPPVYRLKVEAWDVPDQGESEGRYSVWPGPDGERFFEFTFAPPMEGADETPPKLEFTNPDADEIEDGDIESTATSYLFAGTILDNAGVPVRVRIERDGGRPFYVNPYGAGIDGAFFETLQLTGLGVDLFGFDAIDVNGNTLEEPLEIPIAFTPDIDDPDPPILLINEIFPLDTFFDYTNDDEEDVVTFVELGGCLYIAGTIADDEGLAEIRIETVPEDILVDPDVPEDLVINLEGRFPAEQWKRIKLCDLTAESVVTLQATDVSALTDGYAVLFSDEDGDDILEVKLEVIEICDDEIDNDGDDLIDCVDPDCLGVIPEDCVDGIDNDCDGLVDAEDPDCEETD